MSRQWLVLAVATWIILLRVPGAGAGLELFQQKEKECRLKLTNAENYFKTQRYEQAQAEIAAMMKLGCDPALLAEADKLRDKIIRQSQCTSLGNKVTKDLLARVPPPETCDDILALEKACPGDPALKDPRVTNYKSSHNNCLKYTAEEQKQFEDARAALTKGEVAKARALAEDLRQKNSIYPGIDALLQQEIPQEEARLKASRLAAEKEKKSDPAATGGGSGAGADPKVKQLLQRARESLGKRQFYEAREEARQALSINPSDATARSLESQINGAISAERDLLRRAVAQFYEGKHAEARARFQNLAESREASGRAKAIAEFYLGALSASAFYLSGENQAALKDEALSHFRSCLQQWDSFKPTPEGLSSRILDLFEQAAGRKI